MKKNILHNFVFLGFAVLYDGLTLILSSVFVTSIFFNISSISVINGSIGIIGCADMPTLLFVLTKNPVMFLMALFIIFGISTAVIITVVSFKKFMQYAAVYNGNCFLDYYYGFVCFNTDASVCNIPVCAEGGDYL